MTTEAETLELELAIEEFEDRTGLTFLVDGPPLKQCEHCGETYQFICAPDGTPEHDCFGVQSESAAAAWFEDAAYGTDS